MITAARGFFPCLASESLPPERWLGGLADRNGCRPVSTSGQMDRTPVHDLSGLASGCAPCAWGCF
eukprot:140807-Prorocentrum_minimum.AAC.3